MRAVNRFVKSDAGKFLRIFAFVAIFLVALHACIALNMWWVGENWRGFQDYQKNLFVMVGGFTLFTILASRSKKDLVGYIFLCVAVYYVCNYEIGGPSKYSLTPFDPIFGLEQTFPKGEPLFAHYRKVMAYSTSILAALTLALAKLKKRAKVSRLGGSKNQERLIQKKTKNSLCSEKDGILTEKHSEEAMRKIAWWMLNENRR